MNWGSFGLAGALIAKSTEFRRFQNFVFRKDTLGLGSRERR